MRKVIKPLFIFYSLLLFYIFFLARRRPHPTLLLHKGGINITPLKSKIDFFRTYQDVFPAERWKFYTDLFGNIAVFIPLPFFLVLIFNIKSPWKIILTGFLISLCVECTQFILSVGVADIDDIILNTLGTCLGCIGYRLLTKISPANPFFNSAL